MDWISTLVGAFAGGGVLGLVIWLQKALGANKPPSPPQPTNEASSAAVEEVRAVLVEESEEREEDIRDALSDPKSAANTLAHMLNSDSE